MSRFEFVNKLEAARKEKIEHEKKNMVIFFWESDVVKGYPVNYL